MKVVSLQVENYKRVSAAFIKPDGSIVELTGENDAGKTSIIDALWAAIAGKRAIPRKPVRTGAKVAIVKVDLGELKVALTLKAKDDGSYGHSLVVTTADGGRLQNPQEMLKQLIGALSFDPLAFTLMDADEQFSTMAAFVPGVDFAATDTANASDFAKRTDVNRALREARIKADAIVVPEADTPVDESALVDELENAGQFNAAIARSASERANIEDGISRARRSAEQKREQANALRAQAEALEASAKKEEAGAAAEADRLAKMSALAEPIDTTAIRQQIGAAKAKNEQFAAAERAKTALAGLKQSISRLETESAALTAAMEKREADKNAAVAAAEMPVEGMSFGKGLMLLNDEPFDQASQAQKIRASVAIAAALNPKLRIAFVRDGSLLDKKSFALLAAEAERLNFQVWMETVESGRPTAVEIVDGHVKGQEVAPAEEAVSA